MRAPHNNLISCSLIAPLNAVCPKEIEFQIKKYIWIRNEQFF
jgi:hypothetical protein